MFDLPPVQMKRGATGFDFDNDLLAEQHRNIQKLNALKEFDELEDQLSRKAKPGEEETKSLKDLLREKREQNEKVQEQK